MKYRVILILGIILLSLLVVSCKKPTSTNQVAKPTFNPTGGTYTTGQNVTITCATAGATITYTTDGSTPNSASQVYSAQVAISQTTTLKARAFKTDLTDSPTASATYTIESAPGETIFIQGGTFNNGTSNVTLSSFSLGKYEVTQESYLAVMGVNPAIFTGVVDGPVEQVNWFKAIEYCNRRSIDEGLTPCYSYGTDGTNPDAWPAGWNTNNNHTNIACNWTANGYRLPTESEWQFAAQGGNSTHNYVYSGGNSLDAQGWYYNNAGNTTHTVGTKNANELGLFDMTGNVLEWCWDIFVSTYPSGAQTNPHGPTAGTYRVLRGGSWSSFSDACPNIYRLSTTPNLGLTHQGFRICRGV